MAISLPTTTGNIVPEYAATNITFTRQLQNIDGELVAIFLASLSYERRDYLVADGKKIGLVSTDPMQVNSLANQDRFGHIALTATEVGVLFSEMPAAGKVLGEVIADTADALIRADLIKRGIINA
jgi:hypothetical protein